MRRTCIVPCNSGFHKPGKEEMRTGLQGFRARPVIKIAEHLHARGFGGSLPGEEERRILGIGGGGQGVGHWYKVVTVTVFLMLHGILFCENWS